MSTLEGGADFPGVRVGEIDRVAIADISSIKNYRLMHAGEMTVYRIDFHDGGQVDVSTGIDRRLSGLSHVGPVRHRVEGRTLVLEG